MDDNIKDRLQQEVLALAGKVTELTAEIKRITAAAPAGQAEPTRATESIGDDRDFQMLLVEYGKGFAGDGPASFGKKRAALVRYIDSQLAAPAAPSEQAEPDEAPFLKHWDSVSHDYGFGIEFSTAYRAARASWFAAAAPAAPLPDQPEQSATSIKYDHEFQNLAEQFAYQVECNPRTSTEDLPAWQALCFYVDSLLAALAGAAPLPELTGPSEAMIQALTAARNFIETRAEECGYGFARPANPHDFSPDAESCSAEEIAAHKAAFDAYDKGQYTPEGGCKHEGGMHILVAPWGIGSYTCRDEQSVAIIGEIDQALAASPSPAPAEQQDGIEARTERIRLSHANADSKGEIQLRREVEWLLAHIALLRSPQDGLVPPPVAAPVSQQEWISVDADLPEVETDVLVRGHRGDSICHEVAGMFNGEWLGQNSERELRFIVTDWMPLPPRNQGTSPASRMGGITSKESAETAAPGEDKQ